MSDITAPMRGKVFKILVNVGDSLAEDDEVVVLDSMKMEISVYSPGEGTVREIKVEVGETVEAEAVLMTLD